uniref:Uncharacterized protein n=1 Tax=Vitis vinifera TaxID=29760 RepID=F6HT07_VITVI
MSTQKATTIRMNSNMDIMLKRRSRQYASQRKQHSQLSDVQRMSGCGYEAMGLHGGIERERMREMEG